MGLMQADTGSGVARDVVRLCRAERVSVDATTVHLQSMLCALAVQHANDNGQETTTRRRPTCDAPMHCSLLIDTKRALLARSTIFPPGRES